MNSFFGPFLSFFLFTWLSGNFSFQPVCQRVLNFQTFCTTKSKFQKISARPRGPCLRRRHPPEARSDVTRCPVGIKRQGRTRQNVLVLDIDLVHFSWASDHYIGRRGLSPDIPPRRGATLARTCFTTLAFLQFRGQDDSQ